MMAGVIAGGRPYVAAAGVTDPHWSNVVSLLHFDGSDASTAFTDEKGKTWSAVSGAKLTTASKKYGSAALTLAGGSDSVTGTASTDFDFGSGDFTIEAWVYISGNSGADAGGARSANILNTWPSGGSALSGYALNINGSGSTTGTGLNFDTWSSGNSTFFRSVVTISQSAWHHVAVTVSGGVRRLFLDGVLLTASTTTIGAGYTQANSFGRSPIIGRTQVTGYPLALVGLVDDVRITKGVARYTAGFTPPSDPFPNS